MDETRISNAAALRALENLRTRLLDLTARNRLINFHHSKAASLRIIDEMPDQLVDTLLAEKEMRFAAVPEPTEEELIEAGYLAKDPESDELTQLKKDPTAEEWARYLGLATSYEVPDPSSGTQSGKHTDNAIQTLLFPFELETRLKDLLQTAESAIQEMGANILYLACGFLEWYDSNEASNARYAPLFLVPVRLKKGRLNAKSHTYEYALEYTGEDIIPNLSLREKLRVDFQMALPDLNEETRPEGYLQQVREVLEENQPKWRVRRYVSLALLNFSKLLMYLDLDPARWPEGASLLVHPLVGGFLSGYGKEDDTPEAFGFGEEYAIDELGDVHERYPLIDDADSSQHSALVDAIEGKNLVIEGPPGTGKSQTITNLIAAALADGKRVLFVAEKLAALEVVKSRLDRAGLGEFCLELHSHKTQKRKVLDDIQARLRKRGKYRPPSQLDVEIARYEELKSALAEHVKRINRPWKRTQRTLHEILMAATRYREAVPVNPESLHPQGVDGNKSDPMTRRRAEDQIKAFGEVYQAVAAQLGGDATLDQHPWYGVGNAELQLFDHDRVHAALAQWQAALTVLPDVIERAAHDLACEPAGFPDTLSALFVLLGELRAMPSLHGDEVLASLPRLGGEALVEAHGYLSEFGEIQGRYANLIQKLGEEVLYDLTPADGYRSASERLRGLVAADVRLEQLGETMNRLPGLQRELAELSEPLMHLQKALGSEAAQHFALSERGLRELNTLVALSVSLDGPIWRLRSDLFDNDELDPLLTRLRRELEPLQANHQELQRFFTLSALLDSDELVQLKSTLDEGGAFRWFKGRWRKARKRLLRLASGNKQQFDALRSRLQDLIGYARGLEQLNRSSEYRRALGEHFVGLGTDIATLEALRRWYRRVRHEYGVGFGNRVAIGRGLLDLPFDLARGLRSFSEQGLSQRLAELLSEIALTRKVFAPVQEIQTDAALLVGEGNVISSLMAALEPTLRECGTLAQQRNISVNDLCERAVSLATLREAISAWHERDLDNRLFQGALGLQTGLHADNRAGVAALTHTLALAGWLDKELSAEGVARAIVAKPTADTFSVLAQFRDELAAALTDCDDAGRQFADLVGLDTGKWARDCGDRFTALPARNQAALNNLSALQNWLDYIRVAGTVETAGLGGIARAIERRDIVPGKTIDALRAGMYDLIAREILREMPELSRFAGSSQEALRRQFGEYDERLKELQREKIAWKIDQTRIPLGNSVGRVGEFSGLALLEHECSKKKRHIALRQLLHRAGNALSAIKPCFMMGPMSVAQYLAPGQLGFDLIVMDEASQIKPQDALGAIARGAQLIIVGDPKQLPPTSFFDRVVDDGNAEGDDESPTAIEESESILDATGPMFPRRRLRWHYRSRHENLIAFSNHSFYDSDLVLFPSPYKGSDEYGIHYRRLTHGCFVNRRNMEEARVISEAARQHFIRRPDETLGIVAMSSEQRGQIERAIETLAKDDEQFRLAIEEDGKRSEKLFVKNLENVQGDERDVIFISMTYGPQEPGGNVPNRFGPINSDVGWRRLNVLFTRSRKRMHVFSSMGSTDIVITQSSKRGVRALRDFLAYCETGILHRIEHHTGRPPDSDFEVAVMEALSRHGYECVPQVGVAGFFIDVAVVDPGNPGRYLMGIECDGATYHSGKSVRDRDRLRQQILERLGWRIRRIWSTDWFKNPHGELQPIIRELSELKTARQVDLLPATESEADALDEIIRNSEAAETVVEPFLGDWVSLRDRLMHFDTHVIRKKVPDTSENARLLRPAMLEALLAYRPTSKWEFLEYVPSYLRQATAPTEGAFLDDVFEIINGSADGLPRAVGRRDVRAL